jgi:hypothetical protein
MCGIFSKKKDRERERETSHPRMGARGNSHERMFNERASLRKWVAACAALQLSKQAGTIADVTVAARVAISWSDGASGYTGSLVYTSVGGSRPPTAPSARRRFSVRASSSYVAAHRRPSSSRRATPCLPGGRRVVCVRRGSTGASTKVRGRFVVAVVYPPSCSWTEPRACPVMPSRCRQLAINNNDCVPCASKVILSTPRWSVGGQYCRSPHRREVCVPLQVGVTRERRRSRCRGDDSSGTIASGTASRASSHHAPRGEGGGDEDDRTSTCCTDDDVTRRHRRQGDRASRIGLRPSDQVIGVCDCAIACGPPAFGSARYRIQWNINCGASHEDENASADETAPKVWTIRLTVTVFVTYLWNVVSVSHISH